MSIYTGLRGIGTKPKQVTIYTSGSGTYTPTAANAWCFVTMIGGGGAGGYAQGCYGSTYGQSGGGGKVIQRWTKIATTASYAVGAAAIWQNYQGGSYPHYYYYYQKTSSGATTFNGLSAAGGYNGGDNATAGINESSGARYAIWSGIGYAQPRYEYGSANYGNGGGGAGSSGPNGCDQLRIGGNGVAGFIMIEDFGP